MTQELVRVGAPVPVALPRQRSRPRDAVPRAFDGVTPQGRHRRPAVVSLLALQALLVVVVVLQRFVVPGTPVALVLPMTFAACAVLVVNGRLRADPGTTILYLLALLACGTGTLISAALLGRPMSVSSLALLAVAYLPLCLRATPALRARFPNLLEFFQRLMVAAAVACVGQWAAQLAGWEFSDLLSWVPSSLLVANDAFNLSYPLYYGSSILKSNGVVFLEPSFASQFLALAILIQILLARARWRIGLFAAGLLATFSGTGLVLLAVGLAVIAIRRGGRWTARAALVVAVGVAAVAMSPAGALLADRMGESSAEGSSGHARFVAPYALVSEAVATSPETLLVGRGPGSVDRDTEFFNPLLVPANYPVVPKLVAEYGLPAALVFLVFVGAVLFRRTPSPVLAMAVATVFLVLSGALLQPLIVILAWLMTGLFAREPAASSQPALAARVEGQPR